MADDWALSIGINHYPSAGVDDLQGAVSDAERFHEWVTKPDGGGVDGARACLKTYNAHHDNRPDEIDFGFVMSYFTRLRSEVLANAGRRLYIFLSGHGISPAGQQSVRNAALLLTSATRARNWDSFAANIWAEGIRSAALFREVVLLMDCCRDLQNNAVLVPHIFGDPVADSKDCIMFEAYATGWASKAREIRFQECDEKQGIFTHCVLDVLATGRLNGAFFKESVLAKLKDVVKDTRRPQEPEIKGGPDDEVLNRIVFNEAASEARASVSIEGHPPDKPNIVMWPDGSDDPVRMELADWQRLNDIWQGSLPLGQYALSLANGKLKRLKVLAANETRIKVEP